MWPHRLLSKNEKKNTDADTFVPDEERRFCLRRSCRITLQPLGLESCDCALTAHGCTVHHKFFVPLLDHGRMMGAMYPLLSRKWGAFPSVKTSKFEAHRNHEAESNEWKNFKPIMRASLLAQKNKVLDNGHVLWSSFTYGFIGGKYIEAE
jgi:hypothetical protein